VPDGLDNPRVAVRLDKWLVAYGCNSVSFGEREEKRVEEEKPREDKRRQEEKRIEQKKRRDQIREKRRRGGCLFGFDLREVGRKEGILCFCFCDEAAAAAHIFSSCRVKRYYRAVQQQFLYFVGAKVAGFLVVVRVVVTEEEAFWFGLRERERETHARTHRGARILVWKGGFCE
jgi:hypothetical protein